MRSVLLRRRLEREMRLEMETHLEQSELRLRARGLSEHEAARAARREFGNLDVLQEQARDARGGRWLESVLADFRFALRHFRRTPVATATLVMLLALGIGFNAGLFTVIYSMVTMPPPGIARQASLVRIRGLDHGRGPARTVGREFSYPEFQEYAARTNLFSAVAAWTSADVVLEAGGRLHSGAATYVTPNYFEVLGVRPLQGVGLAGGRQLTGVISHAVWDQHFGRAPDVVGRSLKVNGIAVSIVGVAPRGFAGARTGGSLMRVWLPLETRPIVQRTSAELLSNWDSAVFSLGARLRTGVTADQARPTVEAIARPAAANSERWRADSAIGTDVVPLLSGNYYPPSGEQPNLVSRATSLLLPLLILLIPCANVSALLVGLAARRRREIAVRLSLGAGRRRIIRQLLTESVLLALAAGALALLTIWLLLQVFEARLPSIQLVLHWPAFAFTFGIALGAGILFGVSPALHATRVSVAEVLKNAANAVVPTRSRLQSGLVVSQIAMTQPLLIGLGALLLAMLSDIRRLPPPSFGERILQVSFYLNPRDPASAPARQSMLERLQTSYAQLPGVTGVVAQEELSFERASVHPSDRVAGIDYAETFHVRKRAAGPGFFELMGYRFLRGGDLRDSDDVVIRGDAARRLWGSADPLGRRFVAGGRTLEVVGVIDEQQAGRSHANEPEVFMRGAGATASLLVRTRGPAEPLASTLRAVAQAEAPALAITTVRTLAAISAEERRTFALASRAALGSGLVALFLSAIGLYAVVTFAVSQREREIGIRTALGAEPRQVSAMFFLRGLRLSGVGLLIGLSLSAVVVRLEALSRGAPLSFDALWVGLGVALVVLLVSMIATWLPARRAARVDPLDLLRVE